LEQKGGITPGTIGCCIPVHDYAPREFSKEAAEAALSVGGLWIDPSSRTVSLDGKALVLTAVEYEILFLLARSPGRIKSREHLLNGVASGDFDGLDRSIDVHVSSLRKKLADDPRNPRYIETVRSIGYRMKRPEIVEA
jgi:DNA-binding response OmpR family regulator